MKIELIYDAECPNVKKTRENLRRALELTGMKAGWREWERQNPDTPKSFKEHGSPAILINGVDIIRNRPDLQNDHCRLYRTGDGQLMAAPPVDTIVSALSRNQSGTMSSKLGGIIAALPAISIAFLPKVVCPICWPVYAGILSALGLGFLIEGRNLLILSIMFLGLAAAIFAARGKRRRNFIPFWTAMAGIFLLLPAKFLWNNQYMFYAGVMLLTTAVILDLLPWNKLTTCQNCVNNPNGGDTL